MAVREIQIDPATWSGAPEARRSEWRLALQELLEDHAFVDRSVALLKVALEGERAVWIECFGEDGEHLGSIEVQRARLDKHLGEYVGICRSMGALEQGCSSAQLEALDMAKKLAHDDAARAVQALASSLGPDHPTSRRMFTLLLTLFVDTTRLSMVHAHRPRR